jgi:predicted polyphosphate/ATP-dependent NAD kinase
VRLGLIVNPIAGIGGSAGLKGSDSAEIVTEARRRGATPVAPGRAVEALRILADAASEFELLAAPGAMGETEARAAGLEPFVVGQAKDPTGRDDTCSAARALAERGVSLLLFAGGDGTAVDIYSAVRDRLPLLGIPAGVKMHSAVFAINSRTAGRLALEVVRGTSRELAEGEVMDLDETALRHRIVSPRLYGYVAVPRSPTLVQGAKSRSAPGERASHMGIAREIIERVLGGDLCVIGPGTTTRAIMDSLELEKTVLGVDVVRDRALVARDADERTLLRLVAGERARIVVTPIGGQGFLFGRGNQQLSAEVLRRVGRDNVVVVATEVKLAALGGRPLLVGTGSADVDSMLAGYVRVVTGYGRATVYRVAAPDGAQG